MRDLHDHQKLHAAVSIPISDGKGGRLRPDDGLTSTKTEALEAQVAAFIEVIQRQTSIIADQAATIQRLTADRNAGLGIDPRYKSGINSDWEVKKSLPNPFAESGL